MADADDVDALRRRGRRRLLGAIALVLLAVIVLPMVFDPEPRGVRSARTHFSKADRSIFEGLDVHGRVERTIVGGRIASGAKR